MRKLKIIEHISLDGVIQHSADEDEFFYSGWTSLYRTPAGRDAMLAAYGERIDLLLGRRTLVDMNNQHNFSFMPDAYIDSQLN